MPLELKPLDTSTLTPDVARAVNPAAPAAARMMAARGLVPLGPPDLAIALYQLSFDKDESIARSATSQADALPDNVLSAALTAVTHPMVLDFYARRVTERPALVERVLLNRAVHDETLVELGGKLPEAGLEILAGNQARLLACPAIIEAIYFNKRARMSTVQRLMELAARHGITLCKIPHFKEMVAGIFGQEVPVEAPLKQPAAADPGDPMAFDSELDDIFSEAMEGLEGEDWEEEDEFAGPSEDEDEIDDSLANLGKLPVNAKIRLATLGSSMHRQVLIKDSNRLVAMAAISSPAVSETEAARYAANRSLSEDVIRFITQRKDWQKNYRLKVSLINNPKCPLSYSMRMLNHLRLLDLKQLAASKSIPSPLATSAKRLLKTRIR